MPLNWHFTLGSANSGNLYTTAVENEFLQLEK